MRPERQELIKTVAANLEEASMRALVIAEYDKPERLKALAGRVLQLAQTLERLEAEEEEKGTPATEPTKQILVTIPDGTLKGWMCKRCGIYYYGRTQPRRCNNCGRSAFIGCWGDMTTKKDRAVE
jgi:rubrerythrin